MSSFSRTVTPWFSKRSLFSKFITCCCGRQVPAVIDIVPVVVDIGVNPTIFATIVCANQGCYEKIHTWRQKSLYCLDCDKNEILISMQKPGWRPFKYRY